MKFGLCNGGPTLNNFMQNVWRGLDINFPYLDDIPIASLSEEAQHHHLEELFKCLNANGMILNVSQGNFPQKYVVFLRLPVNSEGLCILPEKLEANKIFSHSLVKNEHRFTAMTNFYRRFTSHTVGSPIPTMVFQKFAVFVMCGFL